MRYKLAPTEPASRTTAKSCTRQRCWRRRRRLCLPVFPCPTQFADVKVVATKSAAYFFQTSDLPAGCGPVLGENCRWQVLPEQQQQQRHTPAAAPSSGACTPCSAPAAPGGAGMPAWVPCSGAHPTPAHNVLDCSSRAVPAAGDEDEWRQWKEVGDPVVHIELRRWADALVVAPLSGVRGAPTSISRPGRDWAGGSVSAFLAQQVQQGGGSSSNGRTQGRPQNGPSDGAVKRCSLRWCLLCAAECAAQRTVQRSTSAAAAPRTCAKATPPPAAPLLANPVASSAPPRVQPTLWRRLPTACVTTWSHAWSGKCPGCLYKGGGWVVCVCGGGGGGGGLGGCAALLCA